MEVASVRFLAPPAQLPDGRLKVASVPREKTDDRIKVSMRARLGKNDAPQKISRAEVRDRLGHGSLGSLTNAYFEQQVIADEEIHAVQERFYGLSGRF